MPDKFIVKPIKIGKEAFEDVTVTVCFKRSVNVRIWIATKLIWLAVKVLGATYEEETSSCQK